MTEISKKQQIESENVSQQQVSGNHESGGKVIDETNYVIRAPKENGPTKIGRGGDPFFRRISATREQLLELMEETQIVQDWLQRETCNNVALACLDNENLKEGYYKIKDGFGEYGKISLMGFKTPAGVEIPRLKIYDTQGEVIEVLSGPLAIQEIANRVKVYQNSQYEVLPEEIDIQDPAVVIEDYKGIS